MQGDGNYNYDFPVKKNLDSGLFWQLDSKETRKKDKHALTGIETEDLFLASQIQ